MRRKSSITSEHDHVAEHPVSRFVSAEIKQFPASGIDAAKEWIMGGR
jgi:hypothetical protein